jgi:hypothetical protein
MTENTHLRGKYEHNGCDKDNISGLKRHGINKHQETNLKEFTWKKKSFF